MKVHKIGWRKYILETKVSERESNEIMNKLENKFTRHKFILFNYLKSTEVKNEL